MESQTPRGNMRSHVKKDCYERNEHEKEKAEDKQRGFDILLRLHGLARVTICNLLHWC